MSVKKARISFFMSFPFVSTVFQPQVHRPRWLNENAVLLGELVGINEIASFRILRTITEPAYTPLKEPGKSWALALSHYLWVVATLPVESFEPRSLCWYEIHSCALFNRNSV
jgi:hypothetical protein